MYDYIINFFSAQVPVEAYLAVGLVMFFAGIYGFLTRRNMLMMLISIELMLNAADLNFAVFNRYFFPEQMKECFLR